MPFEIGFRGSTTTGRRKAFLAGVARAIEAKRARHDPATETVILHDGAELHLVLDPDGGMALVVAEEMSVWLSQFVYALADETGMIIQAMGLTAATPAAGEPPALLLGFPNVWRMEHEDQLYQELVTAFIQDEVQDDEAAERQAAFDKALAERRAQLAAGKPSASPSGAPAPSLFQRLSDALFGKAI